MRKRYASPSRVSLKVSAFSSLSNWVLLANSSFVVAKTCTVEPSIDTRSEARVSARWL